jgi:hypothetical protein
MGYGHYSHDAHRALAAGRAAKAGHEVFAQTQCHPLMSPFGLTYRESRDSPIIRIRLLLPLHSTSRVRWATFPMRWRARSCQRL